MNIIPKYVYGLNTINDMVFLVKASTEKNHIMT